MASVEHPLCAGTLHFSAIPAAGLFTPRVWSLRNSLSRGVPSGQEGPAFGSTVTEGCGTSMAGAWVPTENPLWSHSAEPPPLPLQMEAGSCSRLPGHPQHGCVWGGGNAGRSRLQPRPSCSPLGSTAEHPPLPPQPPGGREPGLRSCLPVATSNLTQRAAFYCLHFLVNDPAYLTPL